MCPDDASAGDRSWTGSLTQNVLASEHERSISQRHTGYARAGAEPDRRIAWLLGAGLFGTLLASFAPAWIVPAHLVAEPRTSLFYFTLLPVGAFLAKWRRRPEIVSVLASWIGKSAIVVAAAQGLVMIAAYSTAAPGPLTRALVVGFTYTGRYSVGYNVLTPDGVGYDWSQHRQRFNPGRCLELRPYVSPLGYEWITVEHAAPLPPAGRLAWPQARAACFSGQPLEEVGRR